VATAGPPLPFKSNLTSIPAAELSGDGPLGAFQAGVARTPRKTVSVAVFAPDQPWNWTATRLGLGQAANHTALMQVALQRGAYLAQGASHRGD
jgi:hypothetical protein